MAAELFQWGPEYQLGVAAMDDQHRGLIGTMNELYTQFRTSAPHAIQIATFDRLFGLAVAHFAAEEAHMAAVGFPGLVVHKRIHEDLLTKLRSTRQDVATKPLTAPVFDFLKMWLVGHILGLDMKYAHHPPR